MKVSIYSVHYNKINFLELQYSTLKKYCEDEFEFIVINNGKNEGLIEQISNFCNKNSLKEIRPPHLFNFKTRPLGKAQDHSRSLKYTYDNYISRDESECRVVMDSDLFMFKKFSFLNIIEGADVAGMSLEQSKRYISSYIIIFGKNVNLSNVPIDINHNKDIGIWTNILSKSYKIKWLDNACLCSDKEIEYIFKNSKKPLFYKMNRFASQIIAGCFIHYHQGSEWMGGGTKFHEDKFRFISEFINNIDSYTLNLDKNVHYENACMDRWVRKKIYPLNNM